MVWSEVAVLPRRVEYVGTSLFQELCLNDLLYDVTPLVALRLYALWGTVAAR
jgi:hypothetical protein